MNKKLIINNHSTGTRREAKMTEQENRYVPYKGFYDLREYDLSKHDFKKLWNIQDMLFHMQERKEYFKKWHLGQWERAKEISAEYQQILFKAGNGGV